VLRRVGIVYRFGWTPRELHGIRDLPCACSNGFYCLLFYVLLSPLFFTASFTAFSTVAKRI
jgi:hypothetical protein